jgi:riboflavin kinase/FMN adenylyltransferase
MRHFHYLDKNNRLGSAWITIGAYDGIHLGHQALIQELVSHSHQAGELAVVVSLFPHPALVLGRTNPPYYLTSPEDRASLLEELDVDVLYTYPFSREVSNYTPEEFLSSLAIGMEIRQLWVGSDFALGKDRKGSLDVLQLLGTKFGYRLQPFQQVKVSDKFVSSSAIRDCLRSGDLDLAQQMLGRNYAVRGRLKAEDSSASPTASSYALHTWSEQLLPPAGNYGCVLWFEGLDYPALATVLPQDEKQPSVIQMHLLSLECTLPAGIAQLEFLKRID